MTRHFTARLKRLLRESSGLAATEFALTFPILLSLGLTGMELSNRAIVQMQINQLAVHIADNASRIGDESTLEDRRIYEGDIQDLFYGAETQGGSNLDLYGNGRVILSSLEVVPGTDDDQYIHWQRCMGELGYESTYGLEGDGLGSNFPGMGPPGEEVIAFASEAVMFVELAYEYEPLIGDPFGMETTIRARASFTVRDSRDLTRIYQRDPSSPDAVADCAVYGGTRLEGGADTGGTTSGGSTSTSGGSSSTSTGGGPWSSTGGGSTTSTSGGPWSSTGGSTTSGGPGRPPRGGGSGRPPRGGGKP
ncbi:hypothetical protein GCM10009127_20590 [Alteraurantiacibacter aestuarii]|uniref:TadE/TadG family type IV pilus assembly protein n=1 Tax=Alteraurantiacibacter aestuarii TaxID=650004 RepID=UPI0031D0AF87